MTALSASRITDISFDEAHLRERPQAAVAIYKGGMVMRNSSGYVTPAADASGALGVCGIAYEDSTAPSNAGDKKVKYLTGVLARLAATSITQAMEGKIMYVVDDQTFDDDPGTYGIKAGVLVEYISSTEGVILVEDEAIGRAVAAATATTVSDADADGTYGAAEATLINNLKTAVNALITDVAAIRTAQRTFGA